MCFFCFSYIELAYDTAPLLFSLSFSFLFFGLHVARASPGSTLVNDPLFGAALLIVSVRKTVAGLPDFFLGPYFPCIMCIMRTYTPSSRSRHAGDVLIFPLHVWMYMSVTIVRAQFSSVDAYSARFWAYLLPQTWSARVLTLGRTASKAPPYR